MHAQLGFESEEEFKKYLHTCVDQVDGYLRINEFLEAEDVLKDLIEDVLRRRMSYLRPILHTAREASEAVTGLEEGLVAILDGLEESL